MIVIAPSVPSPLIYVAHHIALNPALVILVLPVLQVFFQFFFDCETI